MPLRASPGVLAWESGAPCGMLAVPYQPDTGGAPLSLGEPPTCCMDESQGEWFPRRAEAVGPLCERHSQCMLVLDCVKVARFVSHAWTGRGHPHILPGPTCASFPAHGRDAAARARVGGHVPFSPSRSGTGTRPAPCSPGSWGRCACGVFADGSTATRSRAKRPRREPLPSLHSRTMQSEGLRPCSRHPWEPRTDHDSEQACPPTQGAPGGPLIGPGSQDSPALKGRKAVAKRRKLKHGRNAVGRARGRSDPGSPACSHGLAQPAQERRLKETRRPGDGLCQGNEGELQGGTTTWQGSELPLDTADCGVPLSAILTSASTHASQATVPLALLPTERVASGYALMDTADG